MKTRHIIRLFTLGLIVAVIGILFNFMSWPYGRSLIILSTSLQFSAGLFGIIKLTSTEEFKELFSL